MTDHTDLAAQAQQAAAAKDYHRAHHLYDQLIDQLRQEGRHLRIRPLLEQQTELYLQPLEELTPLTPDELWTLQVNLICLMDHISDHYGWEIAKPLYERFLAAIERITGADSINSEGVRNSMGHFNIRRHTRAERWVRIRRGPGDVHAQVLEGLDAIPWAELRQCNGFATNVPYYLKALLDDADYVRRLAHEQLMDILWHQGGVFEASAYAVPFLLRLLTWKNTPDKTIVLDLIASIAHGKESLPADWTAANTAAAEGLPLYFRLLYDPDRAIRIQTVWLLSAFPQHRDAIIPQLQEALNRCEDAEEREAITGALERLNRA